jgi:hypothetical protein
MPESAFASDNSAIRIPNSAFPNSAFPMKLMLTILLWCILWALCWPLALLVLLLVPFLWLLSIPFRIFAVCLKSVLALLETLLLLPARLLGYRCERGQG